MRLFKAYLKILSIVFGSTTTITVGTGLLINAFSGKRTSTVANWFGNGIIRYPALPAEADEWDKLFYIAGSIALHLIFLSGAIFLIGSVGMIWAARKYNFNLLAPHPELVAQRQIAAAVRMMHKSDVPMERKHETIQDIMIEFEKGIQALFKLKPNEYRCYWVLDNYRDPDNYIKFSTADGRLSSDEVCIDQEVGLNRTEHFAKNTSSDYADIHEYAWISNLDTSDAPMVGICFMIKKSGVLTTEKEQLFRIAAAHLLVVEQVDSLNKNMVDLLIERDRRRGDVQ